MEPLALLHARFFENWRQHLGMFVKPACYLTGDEIISDLLMSRGLMPMPSSLVAS